MLRRILPLSVLTFLVLSACAPGGSNNSDDTSAAGTTGYHNPDGVPYVSGVGPRMDEVRNQPMSPSQPQGPVAPAVGARPTNPGVNPKPLPTPQTPAPAPHVSGPPAKELRARLKEFEISRFNANASQPSRFGNKSFVIKFWFQDEDPVEFRGEFQGQGTHFSLAVETPKYSLRATFADLIPAKNPAKSEGDLYLTDKTKNEIARILYSAYKAKLTVHQDRLKPIPPGTTSYQQVKDLQENTFGWVNNWAVVQGPAFYLVDIVRLGRAAGTTPVAAPVLAFKGPSLRTGDQDHPAQSLTPTVARDINLIGNSETAGQRWFEATLGGTDEQDQHTVVLDIQEEQPQTQGAGAGPAPEELTATSDHTVYSLPSPPVPPSIPVNPARRAPPPPAPRTGDPAPTPSPALAQPPPARVEPVISGSSYFKIDMSKPRTARISNDFARNRELKTVQPWILRLRNRHKGVGFDLNAFYKGANPFRPMIEAIGRAFDVSPAFAYLSVNESRYLLGGYKGRGPYTFEPPNEVGAWGAFQIKVGTAPGLGMTPAERGFFAPSACGAAKYIGQLVDQFSSSDATMAILGYFQGRGGAARSAVCALRDKSACGGHNFNRYVQLANFGFTYAQMDDKSAIPENQRLYVEKILAIYFVSSDMQKYEMTIDPSAPRSLPTNGTVMPTTPIQDPICRAAIQSL